MLMAFNYVDPCSSVSLPLPGEAMLCDLPYASYPDGIE
jgi:hypothetical protein